MEQNGKLKLFISYSHLDENYIKEFIKHLTPLKTNGLIEDWYDRKITGGQDFQEKININIKCADIVCLFISANFLASPACLKEKVAALELREKRGITVLPIILSACGWLDDKEISPLIAFPSDGNPVSDYADFNKAWNEVYNGLKDVIESENKIKQLRTTKEFSSFLESTDLLSKAHPQKEKVLLDDIFIYPELEKYDYLREYDRKKSSEKLIENFRKYSKILIAGENQSGKTTLCKRMIRKLREENFVPIYISDQASNYQGFIENKIAQAFKEQYEGFSIDAIDKKRIVPILDDFHFAKNKEQHIQDLSEYKHVIIIVDDIFSLNVKDEQMISSFTHFKIIELIPSLRNALIKKWTQLKENESNINDSGRYENLDRTTELVNTSLGKVIGSGIMPAYPFFILSVISTYDAFGKPLDKEITSQGYCYQALIYLYLRKQGVKSDEIDTYVNFLTEFSYFFYTRKTNEISIGETDTFLEMYLEKYNLPIKQETILLKLRQAQIILLDGHNNYSFYYDYIYYFFVAKYLADHVENNTQLIETIINNLHKDENAYIAIFMSHHSKNEDILDEIILNASCLFDKYEPATLSKDELSFFDKQVDLLAQEVLPHPNETAEKARDKKLKEQDVKEQESKVQNNPQEDESSDTFAIELRRSIKTVEVMGRIIKNRAGSLEKAKLESIFEEAMKVHLRILTSFFELIKLESEQPAVIDFITTRLDKFFEEKAKGRKDRKPSNEDLEKMAKRIYWNMNFFVVVSFINKIIHSVGSNKLTAVVEKVCDSENTPASLLVKHGILMWYEKNLQIDSIAKRIDEDGFSDITKKVLKFMIVNHCSMHTLGFKDLQKVENKLGIKKKRLTLEQAKVNEHD